MKSRLQNVAMVIPVNEQTLNENSLEIDINNIYDLEEALEDKDKEIEDLKQNISDLQTLAALNQGKIQKLSALYNNIDPDTSQRLYEYNKSQGLYD